MHITFETHYSTNVRVAVDGEVFGVQVQSSSPLTPKEKLRALAQIIDEDEYVLVEGTEYPQIDR